MSDVNYNTVIGSLFVENIKLRERINQVVKENETLREALRKKKEDDGRDS